MPRSEAGSRLVLEILVTIALAEVVVMYALPSLIPGSSGLVAALLDGLLLALIAGPIIAWRIWHSKTFSRSFGEPVLEAGRRRFWRTLALVIFVVGVGLSFGLFVRLHTSVDQHAEARFERVSDRLVVEAARRFGQCGYGLRGARGLFAASQQVSREEFRAHIASRNLPKEFPGVEGFGLIERVERQDLAAFVARERSESVPDFEVRTRGNEPDVYAVKLIEPLDHNLPLLGWDLASVAGVRDAIERCVSSGEATLTPSLSAPFQAESTRRVILLLPVYEKHATVETPDQRRAALKGILFAPLDPAVALAGISSSTAHLVDFELFDGSDASGQLLHAHHSGAVQDPDDPLHTASSPSGRAFARERRVHLAGRTWTLRTATNSAFDAQFDYLTPVLTGLAGVVVFAGLSAALWFMSTSRGRAMDLARSMTSDLRRLAMVAERTSNAVVVTDALGRVEWVNDGFTRITGYSLDECKGRVPGHFLQCERTDPRAVQTLRAAVRTGSSCRVQILNRGKSGHEYVLDVDLQPIRDVDGQLTGFMAIESDVTERERSREALAAERDRAEAALREASALHTAFDRHAILSVADARGRIIEVNDTFCRISGYTREELLGQDHKVLSSGLHPKSFWVQMWRMVASGKPWRGEVCNRRKDGTLYWVDSMIAPCVDTDGRIHKYVSMRIDITARKEAELAVLAASDMLRRTGAMARVGGWEYTVGEDHVTWSEVVYAIHEIEPGTPVTVDEAIEFYAPEARAEMQQAIERACADRACWDLVLPFVTAKGRRLWVRAQGEPFVEDGRVTRLCGAFQDVTSEVLQRQAIQDQATRLETVIKGANLGTWDWNVDTGEVIFNERWASMLGYAIDEIEPNVRAWEKLVHPDDMKQVMAVLSEHMLGRTDEYRCEHRLRHKNGSWVWVLDVGRVTERDSSGRAVRATGVHLDITAVKEATLAIEAARDAAQAATKAKSEFLANMSHEIRTPLTAILGYADLLRDEGNLLQAPPIRVQTIDTIRQAGHHLLAVINDILDLSKIESGRMAVESVETPLAKLLSEVEGLLRPRAEGKGVSLCVRYEGAIPERVMSDPTRLRQILMNLAGNAIKFTELGGVTIVVRTQETSERSTLQIDVEDTGIGMTADQTSRLFEAFSQADSTMTRRFGGTGLGLMLCRRFASLMKGEVSLIRSEPGKGPASDSRFRWSSPRAPRPFCPAAPPPPRHLRRRIPSRRRCCRGVCCWSKMVWTTSV